MLLLSMVAAPAALAHGDADASVAEFHLHLDDYRAEVDAIVAETDRIVSSYADGQEVAPRVDALIERWEEVAVHGAIESHAVVTYPTIWQAIIGLQQAVEQGRSVEAVTSAGEAIKAAVWQGFGALRLAAEQVGRDPAGEAASAGTEALSGPESIERIIDEVEQAVEAYAADNADDAQRLIHDAYMQRFEFFEGELIEQDAELVSRLEKEFNATLPILMQQGAPVDEVRARAKAMIAELQRAGDLLAEAEASRSEVF